MARKDAGTGAGKAPKQGRIAQIRQTYRMARRTDRWIGWISLGTVLAVLVLLLVVGLVVQPWWLWLMLGLPGALLAGTVVFGRRAEGAAYGQIEGQPGAAAAALGTLRRGWTVQNAIGVNRQQDVVHRVVGRPGVVLVGEGSSPQRVANLLAQERKRHARVVGEVPVYDVVVGRGKGEVPLRRLPAHIKKLPRNLRPAEVTEVLSRLRALGTQPVPLPKGPIPKGVRLPKGMNPPR